MCAGASLPLEVVTESREWAPIAGRRIGGVSSFGFSGTNAHVVVESWEEDVSGESESEPREEVLVVTARTEAALRALAERYAEFLWRRASRSWSEICWTAAVGRAVFGERLAVVAGARRKQRRSCGQWLRGDSAAGVHGGQVSAGRRASGAVLGGQLRREVAADFVQRRDDGLGGAQGWTEAASGEPADATRSNGSATGSRAARRQRAESGESVRAAVFWASSAHGRSARSVRDAAARGELDRRACVEGRAVLPATGHLELMLEAGAEVLGSGCELEDVVFEAPLAIAGERRVQTVVEQESGGRSRVRVYAEQAGGEWERVSEGWLRRGAGPASGAGAGGGDAGASGTDSGCGEGSTRSWAARGLEFGERFRGLQRAWMGAARRWARSRRLRWKPRDGSCAVVAGRVPAGGGSGAGSRGGAAMEPASESCICRRVWSGWRSTDIRESAAGATSRCAGWMPTPCRPTSPSPTPSALHCSASPTSASVNINAEKKNLAIYGIDWIEAAHVTESVPVQRTLGDRIRRRFWCRGLQAAREKRRRLFLAVTS